MNDDYHRKLFESDISRQAKSSSYILKRNRELEARNARMDIERGTLLGHLAELRASIDPLHAEIVRLKVMLLRYIKRVGVIERQAQGKRGKARP